MRIGVLPLARTTFDINYANQQLQVISQKLSAEHDIITPEQLLVDGDSAKAWLQYLEGKVIDHLLLLQLTFTDAATALAALQLKVPIAIWAVPEPRLGGRLRLNAFCGLNLASHALGLKRVACNWLYVSPATATAQQISSLFAPITDRSTAPARLPVTPNDDDSNVSRAKAIVAELKQKRIGKIGDHPPGFATCEFDQQHLQQHYGVEVSDLKLGRLFAAAQQVPAAETEQLQQQVAKTVTGTENLDQPALRKSICLAPALSSMAKQDDFDAFAIRCWPETFTEYGGAACAPVAMLGQQGIPCACEADVYGALTMLVLQLVARQPVFLADLVDIDARDNTGVMWHCGQAPIAMRASTAQATVHSNRKLPLLYQFALKAGRITIIRISRARGEEKLMIAGGEVLARALPFSGTAGVIRFDNPSDQFADAVISNGLEHHFALAYGEHRPVLRQVAVALNLPILEL